tara:strand:+ start:158 stop:616 length:459 start_codon:yes stop_codon:yes gene_type:complete
VPLRRKQEVIDMESITFNQDTLAAMIAGKVPTSDSEVEQLAQDVVDARAELARVKAIVELAEQAFKDTGIQEITLDDGTKVQIVEQSRRTIDNAKLKEVLPTGHYQRVTKRVGDLKLIDGAIAANYEGLAESVAKAITTKTVKSLKVTQPKR